jgi:hypothetical protein
VSFFTLSNGKLPTYVLPAFPAIAFLLGGYLDRILFQPTLAVFWQRVCMVVRRPVLLCLAITWLLRIVAVAVVSQNVVPAFSLLRRPLNQPQEIVDLLRDENNTVACCVPNWNSIQFALDRDNVWNFDGRGPAELRRFLLGEKRTVLVIAPDLHPNLVRQLVPPSCTIMRIIEGNKARFVLLQRTGLTGE